MLLINMLLKNNEGEKERVLYVDDLVCYTISLLDNHMPIKKMVQDIKKVIEMGELHIFVEESKVPILIEKLPNKQKEMTKKAYEIVSNIIGKLGDSIFDGQKRGKLIREAAEEFNVSTKSVYNYLKKYWKGGMVISALVPAFNNCGGKGKEKEIGKQSLGRKREDGIESFKVTKRVKKYFKSILNRYFYKHNRLSFIKCYYLLLKEYFADALGVVGQYPSLGQFRYFFDKNRDLKKELTTRFGAKEYGLKHREILGKSNQDTIPGLVQIDSTLADIYLVSQYDRSKLVGRPVVTLAIDVVTRMIVGVNVGYESPSWKTTMMTLSNVAMDKEQYCSNFGIEVGENEWPVDNITPSRIITDRGPEFLNNNMKNVIDNLGIVVEYTPSHRADLKGIVERMMGTIQNSFRGFVEGEVSTDIRKKANKHDYRMNAALSLYEYTQLIIKAVLNHNNHHVLKDYRRTGDMMTQGIEPIPSSLWEYTNSHLLGYNFTQSSYVDLCVMPRERAQVTAQGIKFKGLFYGLDRGIKEQWFVKARSKGNYSIEITYNPTSAKQIYVHLENGEYEIATLLNHQDVFANKSYGEISMMIKSERNLIQQLKEEHLSKTVQFYGEIQEIGNVKPVKTGESKAKKLKDIKINKEVEIVMNSPEREILRLSGDKGIEEERGEKKDNGVNKEWGYESPFDKFMRKRNSNKTDKLRKGE
ncbi:MAG TPA: transposase [Epulopiscium sp.]|nr:transposase [Candidatus Epulonipiscium sp.]